MWPKPRFLMTDIDWVYVNSYQAVFGDIQWLWCSWHIKKNWRKQMTVSKAVLSFLVHLFAVVLITGPKQQAE